MVRQGLCLSLWGLALAGIAPAAPPPVVRTAAVAVRPWVGNPAPVWRLAAPVFTGQTAYVSAAAPAVLAIAARGFAPRGH